jgi:hypothetical protein
MGKETKTNYRILTFMVIFLFTLYGCTNLNQNDRKKESIPQYEGSWVSGNEKDKWIIQIEKVSDEVYNLSYINSNEENENISGTYYLKSDFKSIGNKKSMYVSDYIFYYSENDRLYWTNSDQAGKGNGVFLQRK